MENNILSDPNEKLLKDNVENIYQGGTMDKNPLLENESKRKNICLIKIFNPKTNLYFNKFYKINKQKKKEQKKE